MRRHLSRGLVPIVYGEFGVGKTSMVRKHFVDVPNVLYLPTAAKLTLTKVFEVVLESLAYTVTTTRTTGYCAGRLAASFYISPPVPAAEGGLLRTTTSYRQLR